MCVCVEKSARAGKDEEVPTARGAGVPHGSDGHADTARGAGEELPGRCGRIQEDHWEGGDTGLIRLMYSWLRGHTLNIQVVYPHLYKVHVTTGLQLQPRENSPDVIKSVLIQECHWCIVADVVVQKARFPADADGVEANSAAGGRDFLFVSRV